ncbi:DUF896 domain-containing protein [Oribacterium sp. WCC10]|uniref:DUF896 domain-containing protein n=1 Tax=Oribacterium sp. WCC10 TaxID=1855343 RepID=UPI0008EF0AC1|nr:DUF896 domain-containing protein [Oribacterium sp. WCC10]SFG08094.1 Uncharacterized protein YnzC, UPF0291/DUF896 family [Oribacterium sp. WCC10]
MITEKEIARINELYHKSKEGGGLTAEEKNEQARLRRAYIDSVKANLGVYLKDIKNASETGAESGDAKAKAKKAMEKTDAELTNEERSVIEVSAANPEVSSHLHI